MTTALSLSAALILGAVGAWGTHRLLARLDLDPAERFALTLALFPGVLGLAAFAGLLAGRPGPLLPSALCVILATLGLPSTRGAPSRQPRPVTAGASPPHPCHPERSEGSPKRTPHCL